MRVILFNLAVAPTALQSPKDHITTAAIVHRLNLNVVRMKKLLLKDPTMRVALAWKVSLVAALTVLHLPKAKNSRDVRMSKNQRKNLVACLKRVGLALIILLNISLTLLTVLAPDSGTVVVMETGIASTLRTIANKFAKIIPGRKLASCLRVQDRARVTIKNGILMQTLNAVKNLTMEDVMVQTIVLIAKKNARLCAPLAKAFVSRNLSRTQSKKEFVL